ncbi:Abi family protein, partial [Staphylococcus cohnii]
MKPFQTHRQQIKKLRKRGLNIDKNTEGSKVMRILEKENYYN